MRDGICEIQGCNGRAAYRIGRRSDGAMREACSDCTNELSVHGWQYIDDQVDAVYFAEEPAGA